MLKLPRKLELYPRDYIRQQPWRVFVCASLLLISAVLCGWGLIEIEKPWDTEVAVKLAREENPKLKDLISFGIWWACLVNIFISLGLLAAMRLWLRPVDGHFLPAIPEKAKTGWLAVNRYPFWVLLIVIIAITALQRAPRLEHSLWNDEEYQLRRYTWGEPAEPRADNLMADPTDWDEVIFLNRVNNHIPFSILGRLSLDIWRATGGDERSPLHFSEAAFRMPSYLGGLLAIVPLILLPALAGLPRTALIGGAVIAWHPWVLRWTVEGRGYALMMLFILLALLSLLFAVRTGRWRWWLAFAACQFLYVLSFPGAVYVAIASNLFLGFYLLIHYKAWKWHESPEFWKGQAPRWVVANVISAGVFLLIYAPSIPQTEVYLATHEVARREMQLSWFQDVLAHVLIGTMWRTDSVPFDLVSRVGGDAQVYAILAGLSVLIVIGSTVLLKRSALIGGLILSVLLAAVIAFEHNATHGHWLYSWYLLYTVVPWWLCVFAAFEWGSVFAQREKADSTRAQTIFTFSIMMIFAAMAIALYAESARYQMFHNRQPLSAASIVPSNAYAASLGISAEQFASYDPDIKSIKSMEEWEDLATKAETEGALLFLVVCGGPTNDPGDWRIFEQIRSRYLLIPKDTQPGLESMFDVQVFEYAGK